MDQKYIPARKNPDISSESSVVESSYRFVDEMFVRTLQAKESEITRLQNSHNELIAVKDGIIQTFKQDIQEAKEKAKKNERQKKIFKIIILSLLLAVILLATLVFNDNKRVLFCLACTFIFLVLTLAFLFVPDDKKYGFILIAGSGLTVIITGIYPLEKIQKKFDKFLNSYLEKQGDVSNTETKGIIPLIDSIRIPARNTSKKH